jgi:hypothetical protein
MMAISSPENGIAESLGQANLAARRDDFEAETSIFVSGTQIRARKMATA